MWGKLQEKYYQAIVKDNYLNFLNSMSSNDQLFYFHQRGLLVLKIKSPKEVRMSLIAIKRNIQEIEKKYA